LAEQKSIPFPGGLLLPWDIAIADERALLVDETSRTLWRLDLKTERWKKIF
jgi:hypothetical protein